MCRSPGHKDQDNLLYDTGSSGKTGHHESNEAKLGSTATASGLESSDATRSHVNPTELGSTGTASGLGSSDATRSHVKTTHDSENPDAGLQSSTSRTAINQKDHMAPRDFQESFTHQAGQQAPLASTAGTSGNVPHSQLGDPTQSSQHAHHTGRDVALATGTTGASIGAHEKHTHNKLQKEQVHATGSGSHSLGSDHHRDGDQQESKKESVLKKIFSSSSNKHDDGGHHQHHLDHSTSGTTEYRTSAANTPHGALPVAEQFTQRNPVQQQHVAPGGVQSSLHQSQHPHATGQSGVPIGAAAIVAVAEAHEGTLNSPGSQRNDLTHHQHNSGQLLSHNQTSANQHEHHSHHSHGGVVSDFHQAQNYEQRNLTGHEQRDLHSHGGNDNGLSHHVHNGVTPLPHSAHGHNHGHNHGHANENVNTGQGRGIAGPGLGAAGVGLATASASSHNSSFTESQSQSITSDSGPATKTQGPHSSNIANVLDPRVQPDVEALKEEKEEKRAAHATQGTQSTSHSTSQSPSLVDRVKNLVSSHASSTSEPTAPNLGANVGSASHATGLGTSAGTTGSSASTGTPVGTGALRDDPRATEITNQARGGELNPSVAVANSGAQETTGHTFATSGSGGTHSTPAYTDNVKGTVTGEQGNLGDASNVYSRKPLDDRVTMPGTFPQSSTNIHKTT